LGNFVKPTTQDFFELLPPDKPIERRSIAYDNLAHPRLTMAYDNLAHQRRAMSFNLILND